MSVNCSAVSMRWPSRINYCRGRARPRAWKRKLRSGWTRRPVDTMPRAMLDTRAATGIRRRSKRDLWWLGKHHAVRTRHVSGERVLLMHRIAERWSRTMLRIAKQTNRRPDDVITNAAQFFGPGGVGLTVSHRAPDHISLEGGGGFV